MLYIQFFFLPLLFLFPFLSFLLDLCFDFHVPFALFPRFVSCLTCCRVYLRGYSRFFVTNRVGGLRAAASHPLPLIRRPTSVMCIGPPCG
jgi:hypothetical protein